jgi:hypothetical protein
VDSSLLCDGFFQPIPIYIHSCYLFIHLTVLCSLFCYSYNSNLNTLVHQLFVQHYNISRARRAAARDFLVMNKRIQFFSCPDRGMSLWIAGGGTQASSGKTIASARCRLELIGRLRLRSCSRAAILPSWIREWAGLLRLPVGVTPREQRKLAL